MTLALLVVGATATPGHAQPNPVPREEQWWFTAWGIENDVWSIARGGGITVAVIDSGVQADIPDLAGVVLPGTNAEGGGGDGRTDLDDESPPGHGTAMAALIASQGAGTGFLGVAPEAKILPIVSKSAGATEEGIRYAADHGAEVINISRGASAPCPPDTQEAVGYALERDAVIVAGAGNEGDTTNASNEPANCAGVLAVGGVGFRVAAVCEDTATAVYSGGGSRHRCGQHPQGRPVLHLRRWHQ